MEREQAWQLATGLLVNDQRFEVKEWIADCDMVRGLQKRQLDRSDGKSFIVMVRVEDGNYRVADTLAMLMLMPALYHERPFLGLVCSWFALSVPNLPVELAKGL